MVRCDIGYGVLVGEWRTRQIRGPVRQKNRSGWFYEKNIMDLRQYIPFKTECFWSYAYYILHRL